PKQSSNALSAGAYQLAAARPASRFAGEVGRQSDFRPEAQTFAGSGGSLGEDDASATVALVRRVSAASAKRPIPRIINRPGSVTGGRELMVTSGSVVTTVPTATPRAPAKTGVRPRFHTVPSPVASG